MSDDQMDQGELTDRFRAFAETVDPAPSRSLPVALIAGGAALVLLFLVVVWILIAG